MQSTRETQSARASSDPWHFSKPNRPTGNSSAADAKLIVRIIGPSRHPYHDSHGQRSCPQTSKPCRSTRRARLDHRGTAEAGPDSHGTRLPGQAGGHVPRVSAIDDQPRLATSCLDDVKRWTSRCQRRESDELAIRREADRAGGEVSCRLAGDSPRVASVRVCDEHPSADGDVGERLSVGGDAEHRQVGNQPVQAMTVGADRPQTSRVSVFVRSTLEPELSFLPLWAVGVRRRFRWPRPRLRRRSRRQRPRASFRQPG